MSTLLRIPSIHAWNKLSILLVLVAFAAACWAANGCGVTGQTVRLDPAFDRTGTLRSDGFFFNLTASNSVQVGDNSGTGDVNTSNLALRGFVSVVLAPIPPTAEVTKVLLHLEGNAPFGNPFGDFVTLSVDHVNVVGGINKGSFLDNTIAGSIATIPPLPTGGGMTQVVELDVTTHVKADLAAGRPISSFRLLFLNAPTVDDQTDIVLFNAFPDDPANQPFATATYQP